MSTFTGPGKDGSMKVAYSSLEAMKFNPGRRSWISYRDLGVDEATGGAMRAEVMHIDEAVAARPTGWHYHTADIQFLMVTEGWVKLEFPELGVTTLRAGESIVIPGGMVHQELESSAPLRLLEISVPADMKTVAVEDLASSQKRADAQSEPLQTAEG